MQNICFIRLEGSKRWLSWLTFLISCKKQRWCKSTGVRQLLPIYISSIKSVLWPNPTTKQGRCAHTHGSEDKHIWSTLRVFIEPTEPGEQINPQSTDNFLYHVSVVFFYLFCILIAPRLQTLLYKPPFSGANSPWAAGSSHIVDHNRKLAKSNSDCEIFQKKSKLSPFKLDMSKSGKKTQIRTCSWRFLLY